MYIIREEDIEIILMDFNTFYYTAREYKTKTLYSKDCVISEAVFNELLHHLSTSSKNIVIDMKNVVSYPSRIFTKLEGFQECIIQFINIENDIVREKLQEDIPSGRLINDKTMHIGVNSESIICHETSSITNSRKNEMIRILRSEVCDNGPYALESSGLYSNYYIDIKNLFMDVQAYYYILFSFAELAKTQIKERSVDAFISSSKNGAIIANILGGLLGIKEVHLIGVGPKYAMESGNPMDSIKEGKKYAYIFDFLCTGTELKIVDALIHAKRAYLVYAAGVARYKKKHDGGGTFQIDTLTDTEEMGINYKIAGDKACFG